MYHSNPYVRSLHSRRAMHGVSDYTTDFFVMLTPEQQKQTAAILDKGKDSVTLLIQSPDYMALPPEVRLAIAVERLKVSGGVYSDFLQFVATHTPEQMAAYIMTPEFATKPADFQLAVAQWTQWYAAKGAQGSGGQGAGDQGGAQGGQGAGDQGGQGAGNQGGQGAGNQGGERGAGNQGAPQGGQDASSLQRQYASMASGNSDGGAKVRKPTPWLLYLLGAVVAYNVIKK